MRLTIIAPDNVFEHEVDPSMELQDVQALIEAETDIPPSSQTLTTDSGTPLTSATQTLASVGVTGNIGTLFLTYANNQPTASSSTSASTSAGPSMRFPSNDADLERMRLQALGDPNLMAELRSRDPEMASAIQAGTQRFKDAFQRQTQRMRQAASEKDRQIALLNADPYDIEAQKKIEEAIRMEAVLENMQHAMEYSPEAFGNVTMLYIDVEVNGHPVKAFVDSGAQTTIISPECAEACGIMRLVDTRFAGMAEGVGTAKILGRIHSAQIRLGGAGGLHLPCSFSVLEGRAVDLLFGLDMLKRHQCCIDLSTNTLRISNTSIPFLAEHELPDKARRRGEQEIAEELGEAAGKGIQGGVAAGQAGTSGGGSGSSSGGGGFPGAGNSLGGSGDAAASGSGVGGGGGGIGGGGKPDVLSGAGASSGGAFKEADIQTLIGLGAERAHAIQLLEASGGNVDVAASMLFG